MYDYKTMFLSLGFADLKHGERVFIIDDYIRTWLDQGWVFVSLAPTVHVSGVLVTLRRESPSRGLKTSG